MLIVIAWFVGFKERESLFYTEVLRIFFFLTIYGFK